MVLGDEFTIARKASGMSFEQAALHAGIARQTYALRESDPEEFRLGELVGVFGALNSAGKRIMREAIDSLFCLEDCE